MLKLAFTAKSAAMPWRLREDRDEQPIGSLCSACGCDIAIYEEQVGYENQCLYCAMADGTIPCDEIPPWDERTCHQIAMDARLTHKEPNQ